MPQEADGIMVFVYERSSVLANQDFGFYFSSR